ncbi:MAG: hypothetical protein H8D23_26500 [Candidatus Brocadiales bacterium]|nr:hypothetical protein [Candidatus Brocadiales bacterium]
MNNENIGTGLSWVRISWDASPSVYVDYYLVELVPLIYDDLTGEDVPHFELKQTLKVERDLQSGEIATQTTFHNLQPNVKFRVSVGAVDTYHNISPIVTDEILSGEFPAMQDGDITLAPLVLMSNGVKALWSTTISEGLINKFQIFADTTDFTELTADRLQYEGMANVTFIPANSWLYVKLRAIDILGRSSPVLSDVIDASPNNAEDNSGV